MTKTINEQKTVNNYPYGSLRTTATFSLEFNNKRGFRAVFQTINPKTGILNKPKKGTYNEIMYMTDTDGFIKFHRMEFYELSKFNEITQFISDNFNLFTQDQIKYLYYKISAYLKMTIYSKKTYCNVDTDKSFEMAKPVLAKIKEGVKDLSKNLFADMKIDANAWELLEDKNYQPFKTVTMQF